MRPRARQRVGSATVSGETSGDSPRSQPRWLLWLLAGSVPGIIVASRLAPRVNERIIRWLLALVLIFVGGKLLMT